jgi:hypothetical protein
MSAELVLMGSVYIDIQKNGFLREVYAKGFASGIAKAKAKVEARGMQKIMLQLLRQKFGRVPAWASKRLTEASLDEFKQWSKRLWDARTLEEVIGKK